MVALAGQLYVFALACSATSIANDSASIQVADVRGGDVKLVVDKQKVECRITSQEGIGRATLARAEVWPQSLVLQLKLKGLESLTLAAGKQRLNLAVSSTAPHPLHVSLGEKEEPVDSKSPYFPQVRVLDAELAPLKPGQLPPPGGWFEITVPAKLLQDQAELKVHWIDFFRG